MPDMTAHVRLVVLAAALVALHVLRVFAQQPPAMPPNMTHEEHQAQLRKEAELKQRGGAAMGFDQDATTHHFRLFRTGGAIEVAARNPADAATVGRVRAHLQEVAADFARGEFRKPLATHG